MERHLQGTHTRRRKRRTARGRRTMSSYVGICLLVILGIAVLYAAGCTGGLFSQMRAEMETRLPDHGAGDVTEAGNAGSSGDAETATEPGHVGGGGNDEESGPEMPLDDAELARLKVNELGRVPIIMYHDIQDYEAEWVRSKDNFRRDLERFYELGYSLVLLSDYLEGNINVPAGRSPLVLTFDDGTRGQFRFVETDEGLVPDPDCAVGILLEFSRTHPEFGHAATFFVYSWSPFGEPSQAEAKFKFLLENGMEIGNHTFSHKDLAYASPEEVAAEIGKLANEVRRICGYDTVSLALPYGGYPKSTENLLGGTWDGQDYVNKGILLVGAEPAPSPYSKKFNPLAIPRIRGSQDELDKWLRELEKYPETRFISDGRNDTVTIRQADVANLNQDMAADRTVRVYAPPEE